MGSAPRIFISCAEADGKPWRQLILTAWKPLEGQFEFWWREKEDDIGEVVEYHAVVLLITQSYLAEPELMEGEFKTFIKYPDNKRGLFWIPIQASLYDKTELGGITPAWGFKAGEVLSTVEALPPNRIPNVWVEIGTTLKKWWDHAAKKVDEKLLDKVSNNQIVIQPKVQKPFPAPIMSKDKAQIIRILPCLIDRIPQENAVRRAAVARASSKKVVFVLPGKREERPDRFADRLDLWTIASMRAKGVLRGNIEFCRSAWPTGAETADPKELFQEYLDSISRSMRLDLELDYSKAEAALLDEAAAQLKARMRDTCFLFWTEIAVASLRPSTQSLFVTVLDWWKRFVPFSGATATFVTPIVVLAPSMTVGQFSNNLLEALNQEHVQMLEELPPIERLDMVNWLTLEEVRSIDSMGGLRANIEALYPNGDEQIAFSIIEKSVVTWLSALT
jgi:hypothetical protein